MKSQTKEEKPPFECQLCGQCCRGQGGIYMDQDQAAAAAGYLGMAVDEFIARFLAPRGRVFEVRTREDEDMACILLGPQGCVIHPVKPPICRKWPYFPAIMQDPEAFEEAKEHCPGLNPAASHAQFVAWARGRKQEEDSQ